MLRSFVEMGSANTPDGPHDKKKTRAEIGDLVWVDGELLDGDVFWLKPGQHAFLLGWQQHQQRPSATLRR